jgi:CHAD domain-containing protein
MAFRFRRKETTADGFRRILREQIGEVLSLLSDEAAELTARIHNARRSLKRLRAALDLVDGEMDDSALEAGKSAFRAVGQKLATSRDATVALETFEKLAPELNSRLAGIIRTKLARTAASARRRTTSTRQLGQLVREVRTRGHELGQTKLQSDGWALIEHGLARSYRSARKMRRELRDTPTPEIVHEWRKLVKRLYFQLDLLRRALPKAWRRLLPMLERLCTILGEFNDLHTLRAAVDSPFPGLDALIERELARALKRSRRIARDVFKQSVKEFSSGLRTNWRKWARA